MFLKARELVTESLTTWQDKCGDATNVPDSVLSMIEGLRTPVSNTPQASPAFQRHNKVRRTPAPTLHDVYRKPVMFMISYRLFFYTCTVQLRRSDSSTSSTTSDQSPGQHVQSRALQERGERAWYYLYIRILFIYFFEQ